MFEQTFTASFSQKLMERVNLAKILILNPVKGESFANLDQIWENMSCISVNELIIFLLIVFREKFQAFLG